MTVSTANLPTTLWQPFGVDLDASGNGSLTLGAPTLGTNWLAYAVVSECPSGQIFAISVSGVVVAHGGTQSPTFAAGSGQTVAITVTGGTANSTLQGVLQGSIQAGNSPQSPESNVGSLTQISGGNIDVTSADVTIEAGQNGVNVSIDTPPVALGSTMYLPATSPTTVKQTVSPDANATGIGVLVFPQGQATLGCSVTGKTSGVIYVDVTDINGMLASGGDLLTAQINGDYEDLIVEIESDTEPTSPYPIGQVFEYLGNSVVTIDNPPSSPAYAQGPFAAQQMSVDPPTTLGVDNLILGTMAGQLTQLDPVLAKTPDVLVGGVAAYTADSTTPRTVDVVVQGKEGASGVDVQVRPDPPQYNEAIDGSISSGGTLTILAGLTGTQIRIRRIFLWMNAAEQVILQTTSGTLIWAGQGVAAMTPDMDWEGWALPSGEGLELKNLGSGSVIVTGRATLDQY